MACVILPSETARLVYGYLMKENLNDIALQFLEKSPYLTDCCQIVKSGYQFNTKLMDKELHDLVQEYSLIHNMVNKKINLLCKTSLLYKRIKLQCESLSEILELILFWKYKQPKSAEQCGNIDKNEKTLSNSLSHSTNNDLKSINNEACEKINNVGSDINNSSDSGNNSLFGICSDINSITQNTNDSSKCENFKPILTSETYAKKGDSNGSDNKIRKVTVVQDSNQCANEIRTSECVPMEIPNDFHRQNLNENNSGSGASISNANNITSENCNVSITSNSSNTGMPELCLSTSVLTVNMNPQNNNVNCNEMASGDKEISHATNDYNSQIKIVRIEKENQSENHMVSTNVSHQNQPERNITLEDGSVLYVSPEVGNVTIDQERNQIIVIPIDYYKSQNNIQNRSEETIGQQPKNDFYNHQKMIDQQERNNLVFESAPQTESSSAIKEYYNNKEISKTLIVDENIITESDFLKNKHTLFEIEKNLPSFRTEPQMQSACSNNKTFHDVVSPQTMGAPLILLSQPLTASENSILPRYRSILPKKEKDPVPSVVFVQPLLDSTQSLANNIPVKPKVSRKPEDRPKNKAKKNVPLVQKCKNTNVSAGEILDMPSIKTPVADKTLDPESKSVDEEIKGSEEEKAVEVVASKIPNEEKENLEKAETEKVETPVFVTRRNSKRLSLSTPRRRSHVRALEFETPPKTKEKKKSRTSPKAKVEGQVAVERKSVRNTLFKSPIPEVSFKSPEGTAPSKRNSSNKDSSTQDIGVEPLNELSIPIATRSPNTKLSDAWENLTGVGCVIGRSPETAKAKPAPKKMWDADLRCFLGETVYESVEVEKKRMRKPEKVSKDNRKNVKKKAVVTKKSKSVPGVVSPSKMSLTSKRNTYSINGNEEGSPLRALLDDLKIVTPFKDTETFRPLEETPLTKLLRENVNTIDIDLSMINTPSFPPTPSILITPDLDDASMACTNYYSPSKDFAKEKMVKIADYFRMDGEKGNRIGSKEAHEKVIDDLVSKAKEIIGIGKDQCQEDAKRRPTGKILSMVKIQMLTQCDKKLCENIPINEEVNFPGDPSNSICDITDDVTKSDLKGELEEKRKRALKKIKVVKENLSQSKGRVVKRARKRKRSGFSSGSSSGRNTRRTRLEGSNETGNSGKNSSWSDESDRKEVEVFHSTPYDPKKQTMFEKPESTEKREKDETLSEIRQELPPYKEDENEFPELTEKSRKKIHYVGHFLEVGEIAKFLEEYDDVNPRRLYLKPSFRRFFQVFYKWLKHPHKHELNASAKTKALLEKYLTAFDKISVGVNQRGKKGGRKREGGTQEKADKKEEGFGIVAEDREKVHASDEEEKDWQTNEKEKRKDEDTEDGFVSILPLKKRKQTVQRVAEKVAPAIQGQTKNCPAESNASQTQNFLQDIDVDRFLSQIHGQSNR